MCGHTRLAPISCESKQRIVYFEKREPTDSAVIVQKMVNSIFKYCNIETPKTMHAKATFVFKTMNSFVDVLEAIYRIERKKTNLNFKFVFEIWYQVFFF